MEYVLWFDQLDRRSVAMAGGKGANLGEMARAGLPVPPGCVVTVEAYDRFVEQAGLHSKIEQALANLDVEDSQALAATAAELQR